MVIEGRLRLRRAACPDDETLARLIDRSCGDAARSKLLAHLERGLPCSHVFVESQRFICMKQRARFNPP